MMNKRKKSSGQEGFTIIEVMIAMVILGIGIFSIVGLQTRNMAYNTGSKKQTEGYNLAMDRVEQLLALPYPVASGNATEGPYAVTWTVSGNAINNTQSVDVRVNWNNNEVAQVNFIRTQKSF